MNYWTIGLYYLVLCYERATAESEVNIAKTTVTIENFNDVFSGKKDTFNAYVVIKFSVSSSDVKIKLEIGENINMQQIKCDNVIANDIEECSFGTDSELSIDYIIDTTKSNVIFTSPNQVVASNIKSYSELMPFISNNGSEPGELVVTFNELQETTTVITTGSRNGNAITYEEVPNFFISDSYGNIKIDNLNIYYYNESGRAQFDFLNKYYSRIGDEFKKFAELDNAIKFTYVAIPEDFHYSHTPNKIGNIYFMSESEFNIYESTTDIKENRVLHLTDELISKYFENKEDDNFKIALQSYMDYYTINLVFPSWEINKQALLRNHVNMKNSTDADSKYGLKSILWTLECILGRTTLLEGLQSFFSKDDSTNLENLWEYLERYDFDLPTTLSAIMKNWKLEQYPIVIVNYVDNFVNIFQRSSNDDSSRWYIPISYTLSENTQKFEETQPMLWLHDTSKIVTIGKDVEWIILNNQATGRYRVSYDTLLWSQIAKALSTSNFDNIHVLNRAQIVDDIFYFFHHNTVSSETFFNVIQFLEHETDYYTWFIAFKEFDYILSRTVNTTTREMLSTYILTQMDKLYSTVGFSDDEDEHVRQLKQTLAISWACKLGHSDCIKQSKELFDTYINKRQSINKNFRGTVYCTAIRELDSSNFNKLEEKLSSVSSVEKEEIITALGCTTDKSTQFSYLKRMSKESIKDAYASFVAVCSGSESGVTMAIQYLADEKTQLKEVINEFKNEDYDLISLLLSYIKTESNLDEFRKAVGKAIGSETLDNEYKDEIDKTSAVIEEVKTLEAKLNEFLSNVNLSPKLHCSVVLIFTLLVVLYKSK